MLIQIYTQKLGRPYLLYRHTIDQYLIYQIIMIIAFLGLTNNTKFVLFTFTFINLKPFTDNLQLVINIADKVI